MMKSRDELLNFFEEHNGMELLHAKIRIFRAYQNYNKKMNELYVKMLGSFKDETDKAMFKEELKNGDNEVWNDSVGVVMHECENKYDVSIEHEEIWVTMVKHTKHFVVECTHGLNDAEKLSDMKFDVQLNDDSEFLADLITFIIGVEKQTKNI
jgi:hypothetical protein